MGEDALIILARLEGKVDNIVTQMEDFDHTLYGNGRPGLKEIVSNMKLEHDQCMRARESVANSKPAKQGNLIQWLMLGAMVATCVLTVVLNN